MIKILITGHGKISSGILSSVELIYGVSEELVAIDFTQEITPEILEDKIEKEILSSKDGVLILSDIAGGTPFKVASILSLKHENVKVIGGMNLPMVLETLSERDYSTTEKLYNFALEMGKEEIKGFELKIKNKASDDFEDEI
ncbi:PTS galactosamine/N-acetylgalactosamine transporter subunit IIA [Streptobacillus moniliformis]|uniref:PTS galactosamine/N-acetylgalactosamine transporter subunit IIA n=1 Tax=Streptobacillus moniliformis TaxID=34105 RepID=UPI0007E4B2FF|nr:PTS galactosamine/N-acetylgalactosamine transporter subunit IIA [Streptobacillus moniliformis]